MAAQEEIIVSADNPIGRKTRGFCLYRRETGKVAWAIALVYVIPVILFFLGYFLGRDHGKGELLGIIGFFLGLALAVLESHRQKRHGDEIRYQIVSFAK